MNRELQDVQAVFRKGRGTRDHIANICWIIIKAREFQKNICFIDYAKAFAVWITTNHGKVQEMGIPDHLTCLLRNLYGGQEATVITGHGTIGSKLGKEYIKAVYCHPAYLTHMQSTSCKMPGWMKHKLESRLWGEISRTSNMQTIRPLRPKWRGTKEPLVESERGRWKSWLKTQHSEN